ncbi:MAG TPA: hypothetical protein VFT29_19085 [Gemmatimonadaceae bacterium]|nr:hypothetical protein [Gemmatimonadaceae bacterium]
MFGLVAFERSSEASEATPGTSNAVTRQGAKAPSVVPKTPAATAKRTLSASRQFSMAMLQAISSRTAKAGNSYSATVVADVRDDAGRVVLPATSLVSGTIAEVTSASSRNGGTLTLTVNGVTIRGKNYPLTARIDSLAAGAIIGQIITRHTHGTVIGAAVGSAADGIQAGESKDSDIRLPEGTHVIVTLTFPLTVWGRS